MNRGKKFKQQIFFLLIYSIVVISFILILFINNNYHEIYDIPKIESSYLNLSNYDSNSETPILLNGIWELYPNKLIVTEESDVSEDNYLISIPSIGQKEKINFKGEYNYASYKINLLNYNENLKFRAYLPDFNGAYKIFLNKELIGYSGNLFKEINSVTNEEKNINEYDNNCELIIEVVSKYTPIIRSTPVLLQENIYNVRSTFNIIISSIYIGMIILIIILYLIFTIINGKSRIELKYILALYLCVIFSIITKGEFNIIISYIFPKLKADEMFFFKNVIIFVTPILAYLSTKELVGLNIRKNELIVAIIIDLILFIMHITSVIGIFKYTQYGVTILICVYFTILILKIYHEISKDKQYVFPIRIGYIILLSGICFDAILVTGLFIFDISLYLPTCFTLFSIIIIYTYIKRNLDKHKIALQVADLKLQIKEKEAALMLSQIKPHFLYNTLTTIYSLFTTNTEMAKISMSRFTKYLRLNMRSITSKEPILFNEELYHIENYIEIEKLRFLDRLNVVYDIKVDNFKIPPITIQPLVENAIKHGICKKIQGGTVIIKSYEDDKYIYIEVNDDGVGFDTDILECDENDSLGIKNIKFRIENLTNGLVELESTKDIGTNIKVKIPRKEIV